MEILKWCLTNWRIISVVLLLAGVSVVSVDYGKGQVQQAWDKDKLERSNIALAYALKKAKQLAALEDIRDANIKEIDRLRADNARLERLRLPKTTCPRSLPTVAEEGRPTGTGELHESVSSSAEEALNKFDGAYRDEAYRADNVVEECRVINEAGGEQ